MDNAPQYVIEMLHITKEFNGVKANDDITLQLKKGEIHALLGENGAGKSTLMSILFGMLQPEAGTIKKNGQEVHIASPNDATALHIGMVHQHFKLIDVFSVLDNIILGAEDTRMGFLQKKEARRKVKALSEQYGLKVDLDAKVESITVGMQQRVEILKMLYRDNEVLIFDEPTAVLTPQEIEELMHIMRGLAAEGKSILFISHKLSEIMEVSDRVTVLRKGRYIGTVNTCDTNKEELSRMIVGRDVKLKVDKGDSHPGEPVLKVSDMHVASHLYKRDAVNGVTFDVRSGDGVISKAGALSGGNQQKAIIARELDRDMPLIIAVQPTRGLDVGAIEYIHRQLIEQRDAGKAVLLVSLELDEVMNLADRILVMFEGEIVGEFDPKNVTIEELGLYMAGGKRQTREVRA